MLFNSQIFLLGFFPLSLVGFAIFGRRESSRIWYLIAISALFYAYWEPAYVALILGSILVNWTLAMRGDGHHPRAMLVLAIAANLVLLGLFKYLGFFATAGNQLFGTHMPILQWALPLGISFFTFHHIIYLADRLRGSPARYSLRDYALYILLFPQVLAGPLVRHSEIIHQFKRDPWDEDWAERWARGFALLAIGLVKKVFIADALTPISDPVFAAAAAGKTLSFLEAWSGILGFTFQIYFDFSGYSDMAIGIALIFGLTLPMNFDAPYIASSLQDFWRRWHMTLSRFLRDYLYISFGGNRYGLALQCMALMLTMLLGGLWHGAGWTFLVWGGLHGMGLCAGVLWRKGFAPMPRAVGWPLTFLFVSLSWVFFRATDFAGALRILSAATDVTSLQMTAGFRTIGIAALIAILGPTSQTLVERMRPRQATAWAIGLALTVILFKLGDGKSYEFIYFQF